MIELAIGIAAFIFIALCAALAVSCVLGALIWLFGVLTN